MKILVIGNGGREHALVWKLRQSARVSEMFCVPGNGGICEEATCMPGDPKNIESLLSLAHQIQPDITVVGHNDLLASLAKCCNPVPGEKILGYITRGRGVSVHSDNCPNVRNLLYDPERQIDVAWAGEKGASYAIELDVVTDDRPGLLADLTQAIAGEGSNIRRIEARSSEDRRCTGNRCSPNS